MEHFCWFGYLNQLRKYGSVHSIAFQTHWKENSLSSPLLFNYLPLSDFLPLRISVTLCGGGMDIFWNYTMHRFYSDVTVTHIRDLSSRTHA